MPPHDPSTDVPAIIQHMIASYFPFILFAIFAPAALKEWLELAFAALFRRVPVAIGIVSIAMMAFLGALAWAAYFNWLQVEAQFSQGQSLDAVLAAFPTAPVVVRLLTPVQVWTKDGLALGIFVLAIVLVREARATRLGSYP